MSAEETGPSRFKVVWMSACRDQLTVLKNKALQYDADIAVALAKQLRTIQRALEYTPLEWGESITDLQELELTVCLGFHEGIIVNYGVNIQKMIVFVRSLRLLRGHFLA